MNRVQQLCAREDPSRLSGHRDKQLEFSWSELDATPCDGGLHSRDVQPHLVAHLYQLGLRAHALHSPEDGTDAGDELLWTERLHDVVVRPQLQADKLVRLVVPGRE